MSSHQVKKSAETTSPPLNELPLGERGQDCGQTQQRANTMSSLTRSVSTDREGCSGYKKGANFSLNLKSMSIYSKTINGELFRCYASKSTNGGKVDLHIDAFFKNILQLIKT